MCRQFTLFLGVFAFWFTVTSCKKEVDPPEITPKVEQTFPIVYQAQIPEGKLPFPHHNPDISQADYEVLVNDLFIINNYGLYQCGEIRESCYFHDGLDIILDNGTPIFALEAGTVRARFGNPPYYLTLVVEDEDEAGMAWAYTHVNTIVVEVGDRISQGQYLAEVKFQGLEHIHLSRVRIKSGGSWDNLGHLIHVYPDEYFTFLDDQAPYIKTPFHFFKNESDEVFRNDGIDTISGAVDIVVSMRDAGAYAGDFLGNNNYWGDRLAVREVSYRILKDSVEYLHRPSFDFTQIEFVFNPNRWQETLTIFKYRPLLDIDPNNNNAFFSHYILTNAREGLQGQINPEDGALAWNTLELDEAGLAKYPNGQYQIEVTAYDSNGNKAVQVDEVFVKN